MNDTFGGDINATQSVVGAATDQKAEGIAPILIKQVLESPEGNFQMFGMTFGMVSAAVIVRSIDTSSTKVTYLLEDHTGRIEAHYWLDEGDTSKAPDVMLNNYAKVYGSVRQQSGQKTLMVFRMFPIADPNELNTHILEVLNARYSSEDFAKNSSDMAGGSGEGGGGYNDFSVGGGNVGATGGSAAGGVSGGGGLEGKQMAVFQAIRSFVSDEGMSRQQLQGKFGHIKREELNQILDFLSSEGHIYSSIDADHFVCTEI